MEASSLTGMSEQDFCNNRIRGIQALVVPVWLQSLAKYLRFRVKRGKNKQEKGAINLAVRKEGSKWKTSCKK